MKQFGVFGTLLLSLVKHYKKTLPNSESKNSKRLQFILMFSALTMLFWEKMGGTWGHRWYEKGLTKFDDLGHFEI